MIILYVYQFGENNSYLHALGILGQKRETNRIDSFEFINSVTDGTIRRGEQLDVIRERNRGNEGYRVVQKFFEKLDGNDADTAYLVSKYT